YLRKETSRRILDCLASSPATFKEIKSITKKSPATTSIVLKQLLDLGLIKRESRQDGSFEIADKENIYRMLQKINAKDIKL
ncbi:MAG TPA: winged helix-turn-helix domain-containing protein, partial [Candidatus Nitrosotenuis sp.]|nr:winged helix-turn-helix domain-containing protein [Candidatus Nitrosotenuis sp.]